MFVAVAPVHGDGVGTGAATSAVPKKDLPLKRAIAVPPPAKTTIRATTAPMMRADGVRWTGACGSPPVGE
jgi:hypothetical protein